MIVPLFVGREKSVRALEDVMREDKQIQPIISPVIWVLLFMELLVPGKWVRQMLVWPDKANLMVICNLGFV